MNKKAIGPPGFYSNEKDTWDYLFLHYNGLKKFLQETVEKGMGLIVYLS